jgi:hypothetical protein
VGTRRCHAGLPEHCRREESVDEMARFEKTVTLSVVDVLRLKEPVGRGVKRACRKGTLLLPWRPIVDAHKRSLRPALRQCSRFQRGILYPVGRHLAVEDQERVTVLHVLPQAPLPRFFIFARGRQDHVHFLLGEQKVANHPRGATVFRRAGNAD